MIDRKDIFRYVKDKYNVEEDYPLPSAPFIPVIRHTDNRKWFALIVETSKENLGMKGPGRVDVINLKMTDSLLVEMLAEQDGYYRGYPISRGNWISIVLDGSVSFDDICSWIDVSYMVTASAKQKQIRRAPKEWLVPANPKYYDIEHAFDEAEEIDWKQGKNIRTDDTVFIYAAAPVSAVLYKCKVIKTDIPYDYCDGVLKIRALMKIKLIRNYQRSAFTFEKLKDKYGVLTIRGPRSVPALLSEALNK